MDRLELLAEAIGVARQLGFEIREEPLAGAPGGACRIKGRKLLFVDSQLGPRERLMQVLAALRADPALDMTQLRPALRHLLEAG
jgi:hypothetical protein